MQRQRQWGKVSWLHSQPSSLEAFMWLTQIRLQSFSPFASKEIPSSPIPPNSFSTTPETEKIYHDQYLLENYHNAFESRVTWSSNWNRKQRSLANKGCTPQLSLQTPVTLPRAKKLEFVVNSSVKIWHKGIARPLENRFRLNKSRLAIWKWKRRFQYHIHRQPFWNLRKYIEWEIICICLIRENHESKKDLLTKTVHDTTTYWI